MGAEIEEVTKTEQADTDSTRTLEPGWSAALFDPGDEAGAEIAAAVEKEDANVEVEGEQGAQETATDVSDEVEFQFGQEKLKVSKADEAAFKRVDELFRKKQSEADRASNENKALQAQVNTLAAQMQLLLKASAGSSAGQQNDPSHHARQRDPVEDEFLSEVDSMDRELNTDGKLAKIFRKFADYTRKTAQGAAGAVLQRVNEDFGPIREEVQVQTWLPGALKEQIEADSEDPDLAPIVADLDQEELRQHLFQKYREASAKRMKFNALDSYRTYLLKQRQKVSGDAISNGHANGNGAAKANASAASAGNPAGLRKAGASRVPAAMRTSPQAWSVEAYEAERAKAWNS